MTKISRFETITTKQQTKNSQTRWSISLRNRQTHVSICS